MVSFGTCCVIGGKGWTGSYLTKHLINVKRNKILNRDYDIQHIHVIDVPNDKYVNVISKEDDSLLYTTHHTCDITDFKKLKQLLCSINPTVIYHLASVIDLRMYPSSNLESVNIRGTWNILYILINHLDHNTNRFLIYTSSIDVASTRYGIKKACEDDPYAGGDPVPSNHYKRTKITAEQLCLSIDPSNCNDHRYVHNLNISKSLKLTPNKCNNRNIRSCALRPGHIYGPYDPIQETIINSIVTLPVGPKHVQTSFIYVSNCAYGHILATRKLQEESYQEQLDSENVNSNVNTCIKSNKYSRISGQAYFITDFDYNFFDFYYMLSCKSIPAIRLPRFMLILWIFVVEFIENVLHYVLNYDTWQHPITGITSAAYESCAFLTCCREKAAILLEYRGDTDSTACYCEKSDNQVSRDNRVGITCRYCAMCRTQDWWKSK